MGSRTFVLNNTSELDKISCHFYDPEILETINKIKKKGIPLSTLKEDIISGPMGFQLHTYDYVPETFKDKVKLLQISNISKLGNLIDTKRDKFISLEKNNQLKNSKVKKGDLIISKTAELGRLALFNEDYKANLNQALGIIRLKKKYNSIEVLPEYIHLYLNSPYAKIQFEHYGGFRAGQSGLSLDEIGFIYVILPSKEKQEEILKEVDKIRKEAIKHYKNYLDYSKKCKEAPVEILKIQVPSEKQNSFIFEEKVGKRIDAINNSPFLAQLKLNIEKYGYKKLKYFLEKAQNKFQYSDFYNLIDLDNIDENIGKIKSWAETSQLNSAKTTFKTDNILISKLGGEKGNVVLIEEKFNNFLGSGELVDFKLREGFDKELLEYLFYLLRSPYISKQIEYTLSGCSRMRINSGDMENLLIPFTQDKNIVKKVIKECSQLRDKAISEKQQYKKKMNEIYNKFPTFLKVE